MLLIFYLKCWNIDIFVISYNTYLILNAYQAHHLVYSSYRVFNGYQACSIVKQFKPYKTVVTEWLCNLVVVTEKMSSSTVFTKHAVFTEPSVDFCVYRVRKVNKGCSVYRVSKVNEGCSVYRVRKVNEGCSIYWVSKLNEGFSVYQVRKVKEVFSAYQVIEGNRRS